MYYTLGIKDLDPKLYYTKEEIYELNQIKNTEISNRESYLPYVFENVVKVRPDHYVVFLSAMDTVKLYNRGIIRYRLETQRQPTIKIINNKIIKSHSVNYASVEEIKELMIKGKFITNYITLNTIDKNVLSYDKKSSSLYVNSMLDIADGFHRSIAMMRAIAEVGNIDYITGINITNYSKNKIVAFIRQENHRNQINRRYAKALDLESKGNIVADNINTYINSDLKDLIAINDKVINMGYAITRKDIIQLGVERYFNPKTNSQIIRVSDYLISGLNNIVDYFTDEFLNYENNDSLIVNKHIFLMYLYILKKLKDNNPKNYTLKDILEKIDFTNTNDLWQEVNMHKSDLNKTEINKLELYVDNLFN